MTNRCEDDFDDVGRAQVLPVLGREVVEGEQRLAILAEAFDRLLVFSSLPTKFVQASRSPLASRFNAAPLNDTPPHSSCRHQLSSIAPFANGSCACYLPSLLAGKHCLLRALALVRDLTGYLFGGQWITLLLGS
jgi:hypothetical protein